MKNNLKKITASALAALTIFSAAVPAAQSYSGGFSIAASAADVQEYQSGSYTYTLDKNSIATIVKVDKSLSGKVTIPEKLDGNKVEKIAAEAFMNCEYVTEVTVPNSIVEAENAFHSRYGLSTEGIKKATFLSGRETIPAGIFEGVESLKTVVIPSTVRTIGECAFSQTGIEGITLPDGLEEIGGGAFRFTHLASVDFKNVKRIGSEAFMGCDGLTEVTIPKTVTQAECAFHSRYGSSTEVLKKATFEEGMTVIPAGIFSGVESLRTVVTPDSMIKIGDEAFRNTSITSIDLKDVETIGYEAFMGCDSLTEVTIPNTVTQADSAFHSRYGSSTEVLKKATFEEGMTVIPAGIFSGVESLRTVVTPDSMIKIGDEAFRNTSITSIDLKNVEAIGYEAFMDCSNLTEVTIPNTVTQADSAFHSRYGSSTEVLKKAIFEEGMTVIPAGIFSGVESLRTVVTPDSMIKIGDEAFRNTSITSIDLKEVETIGYEAFMDCGNLTEVTIPNTVTTADSAFHSRYGSSTEVLKKATFEEGMTVIPAGIFSGVESLRTVVTPDSMIKIGDEAFRNTSITSIDLKDVEIIGYEAFMDCGNLTEVTIPNTVTTADCAFHSRYGSSTENIKSVSFEDGMTIIPKGIFSGVESIETVNIPASVNSVKDAAFKNCTGLKDVYFSGTETQWKDMIIGKNNDPLLNANIHFHVHKYTEQRVEATCEKDGRIVYTCSCGKTYTEVIKATGHDFGDWIVTQEAYGHDGKAERTCSHCGKTETKVIKRNYSVEIPETLEINYKSSAVIRPQLVIEDGMEYTVKYESSDPSVATVDKDGNVTTLHKGTAKITCTVTDENGTVTKDTCTLNVSFSIGQWIIWIVLFGFLWY